MSSHGITPIHDWLGDALDVVGWPDTSPTDLYRCFDAQGNLLYVGISLLVARRFHEHSNRAEWWGKVAFMTVEHFLLREIALDAEEEAIRLERPEYNRIHNGGKDAQGCGGGPQGHA